MHSSCQAFWLGKSSAVLAFFIPTKDVMHLIWFEFLYVSAGYQLENSLDGFQYVLHCNLIKKTQLSLTNRATPMCNIQWRGLAPPPPPSPRLNTPQTRTWSLLGKSRSARRKLALAFHFSRSLKIMETDTDRFSIPINTYSCSIVTMGPC